MLNYVSHTVSQIHKHTKDQPIYNELVDTGEKNRDLMLEVRRKDVREDVGQFYSQFN